MAEYQFLAPFTLRNGVTIKNRIAMAPTTLRSSLYDGSVSDNELAFYDLRAGATGLIVTEVANVNALGKGFEGEISVADDDMIPGLAKLAGTIKAKGSKAILQIFSAGRQSSVAVLRGQQPVSASAVAFPRDPNADEPRALTEAEILQTIKDFGDATRRAIKAGFDGVELHGANLYLLQQFFSPDANRREDQWGGSLENRMRFGLAVVDEVATVIKNEADRPFILGYRQSPEEPMNPGIEIADSLAMAKVLADKPIDYLHLSLKDAFQSPFKDKTDQEAILDKYLAILPADLPLMIAGLLRTPEQVEALIQRGVAFAALGRELIVEPNWGEKVIAGDEKAIRYALSPSDTELLNIPHSVVTWLYSRFKNGLSVTTDEQYDINDPAKYYKG
ncbi:NADH-dependent flavin oxidoreductase [Periweissella cryptocerci]|uniref:NADH-dependent flavin oxidoreductase n=1 Tax=Periweissella cryptocerci TaxID=2506420 RepID=A0A4P6YT13_9LACO|nr:NADH-dependent flavin oxidoreductase [Periweissella cryptocerci]QBO35773.1 NADH-dependent flavin oxidoreductase [Periweissella cryptocerci]